VHPYHRLTFNLPPEQEDELSAELWHHGTIGLESRRVGSHTVIEAYFDRPPSTALLDRPSGGAQTGIELQGADVLPDRDWLELYRELAQPFELGRLWWIDPGEPDGRTTRRAGRVTLRVPARRAFGTGSHESTRLVLEWLEDLPVVGRRVLDLGTGSGILSLAASHLGAGRVVGVDRDATAVMVARDNQALNQISFGLVAGSLRSLREGSFDLALVNILPTEWVAETADLVSVLAPGATIIFSGVSAPESVTFLESIARAGFVVDARRRAGDWLALKATLGI